MKPVSFQIRGLFGRPNPVTIDLQDKVKILYGINGSGKTTILRLLHAILSGRLYEIRNISFTSLLLQLDDRSEIRVTREKKRLTKEKQTDRPFYSLCLERISPSGAVEDSSHMDDAVELGDRVPLEIIENEIPELSRVGRHEWSDTITGDILTLSDVIGKYSDRLPWLQPSTGIDWYRRLISNLAVKFIQTQRLMTMKTPARRYQARGSVGFQNTVSDYCDQLRELIRDKLSNSMQMAQALDSSYPKRLMQGRKSDRLDDRRLRDLLGKTEHLARIIHRSGSMFTFEVL